MAHKAAIDIDELEKFTVSLKEFNENLKNSSKNLMAKFSNVGITWRDTQHHKFAQEFFETMKVINHFLQTSEGYIPFLRKKIHEIRDYLGQS